MATFDCRFVTVWIQFDDMRIKNGHRPRTVAKSNTLRRYQTDRQTYFISR